MIKVLIVDDEQSVLNGYRRTLRKEVELVTALGGEEGLKVFEEQGPFSVVVSDQQMPGMDGLTFLGKVTDLDSDSMRVMLTGNTGSDLLIKAINDGRVYRFLEKPCPADQLLSVIREADQFYNIKKSEQELLERTLAGSVKLLVDLIGLQDERSAKITHLMRGWGEKLGPRIKGVNRWELDMGIMLHSIGIITLPGDIQLKMRDGDVLTETQLALVEQAPEAAKDLISNIPRLDNIAEGVLYQGKGFNSNGFPYNTVSGKEIPLLGRILKLLKDLAIEYHQVKQPQDALNALRQKSALYDPDLLAFAEKYLLPAVSSDTDEVVYEEKSVSLLMLEEGDLVMEDVHSKGDHLLLGRGHILTTPMIQKLRQINKVHHFAREIKVQRKVKSEQLSAQDA
ncbi:MAG: response regulator [Sneathiellales bacterium]|nr:response regulator [Sneathiellales bacterium]